MEKGDMTFRSKVFKEELTALKNNKYINELDFHKIDTAYNIYLQDLDEEERKEETVSVIRRAMSKQHAPVQATVQQQMPVSKNPKPVKTISAETIRERNISWALILGVILLFIGGLIFGTSNWNTMTNLMKVVLVSFVSVVFFASSYIAEKYFKIHKTAFAFLTLGSLFLPISFISIGFFDLLGKWLSFHGGGKYILGFMGSMICFPLYTYIASKYKQRLFVWFSYLTATIGVGFLLAATYLPRDFFYLGIMVYNGILLLGYYKLKEIPKFELFTKELPVYSQLNLVLSSILMIFFFDNAVFNSFNILITSALYMSMVFVYKSKHYHYFFTLFFVYGMYQLIENSFLQSINYVGVAFIGILYLVFQQYAKTEEKLRRVFQLTSGIISFCAFIFISIQGLILRSDKDSLVLLLAYIVIAINYIYLSNIAKQQIFRYLAPFFLMIAGFQSYYFLFEGFNGSYTEFYMFMMAVIMYVVLYLKNSFKYLITIRTSSFIISIGTMLLTILFAIASEKYTHAALLFLAFGFMALVTNNNTANKMIKKISTWVNPISWALSFISIFKFIDPQFVFYRHNVEIAGHLAIGGLVLLAISYWWKSRKESGLDFSTFLTAVSVYTFSMLISPLELYEHPSMTSCIYFVGIVIYVLLVYKIKRDSLWILVSITSVAFLSSLTVTLKMENNDTVYILYLLLIPIILLLVYEYIGRKIKGLKPYFFWTAHVYLANIFIFAVFFTSYAKLNPALLFIGLGAYVYSAIKQTKEWEIKIFLYASFTTLPIIVYENIIYYELGDIFTGEFIFLIVSGMITVVRLFVNETWKKRIDWYLIPQSILGLCIFIPFIRNQNAIDLVLFVSYTIFTLFLLHRRKWSIFTIFPLIIATVFLSEYLTYMDKSMQITLVLVVFFALHLLGKFVYKQLFNNKITPMVIDWYTVISSIYVILLFVIISYEDPLWLKLVPALLVVYFFYSLINRFSTVFEKRITQTITAVSGLLPYYMTLLELNLNKYLETELYVLPYILLTIFLSRKTWQDYKKVMSFIQLIVLLIVTLIILVDALNSNTIYDALIVGVLSLVSILGGMHYRIKAYFFVGIGVLLLNVLLQTRPYWGNFPWWGYLSIAGLTLVSFAGYNELQKQKNNTNKKSFLQAKKEQFINMFKDWD